MDPVTLALTGMGIGAVGSIYNTKKTNKTNMSINQQQLAQSKEQFDISRTRSIRDRVRDAKLAQINPLTALGATGTQLPSSPAVIPAQKDNTAEIVGQGLQEAGRLMYRQQLREQTFKADQVALQNDILRGQIMARQIKNMSIGNPALKLRNDGTKIGAKPTALKPEPAFKLVYDNRSDREAKEGEYYVLDEEIAEGMEGFGPLVTNTVANTQNPLERMWQDFVKWISETEAKNQIRVPTGSNMGLSPFTNWKR